MIYGRHGAGCAASLRLHRWGEAWYDDANRKELFPMKKLLMILIAALLLSACGCAEEAEQPVYASGDWAYVLLEDGTAEIKYYDGESTELTVPAELDGYAVTSIGDQAFNYSRALTSIMIPDSVTRIGDLAFNFSKYLTSITIPDSVTCIGANPFLSCKSLTDIIVSPEHPTLAVIDGVLFDKVEKRLICYPFTLTADSYVVPQGTRVIGDHAFSFCESLASITLPDSVENIGVAAFAVCESLTGITLPDAVTSIGESAFADCPVLASVTLPDNLTSIDACVFSQCPSLTSITLPDLVTSIGEFAFDECTCLTRIELPDNLTSIGDYSFAHCCSLESIALPDGLTSIGDSAFSNCGSLTGILLPDSVENLGSYAFDYCNSLTSITLPDSLTSVGDNPFYSCSALTSISVSPEHPTLESVDGVLFDKVEKRLISYPWAREGSSYVVPEGTLSIGNCAFEDCYTLTNVTLPASLTAIGRDDTLRFWYTLTIPRDTWLTQWCEDNDLTYTYAN